MKKRMEGCAIFMPERFPHEIKVLCKDWSGGLSRRDDIIRPRSSSGLIGRTISCPACPTGGAIDPV